MRRGFLFSLLAILICHANDVAGAPREVFYEGFTVWLDCKQHGAIRFRYNAQRDTGNFPRSSTFRLDPAVPYECQPSSTNTFKTTAPGALTYERGHLVPANHMDYSELAIKQSNYMTNILPMAYQLNHGAWDSTEEIIECLRDTQELLVIGGVIWGTIKKNDHFVGSHNIKTPDKFWKVIIAGDGSTIAWLMPNNASATKANLDKFLITPAKLESQSRQKLPEVPKAWRKKKPLTSWAIPDGCDLS